MSNGDPPPQSAAPYIIICSGRMAVANAKSPEEKAVAVSLCAGQLCSYMGIRYRSSLDPADMHNISMLQHELMDYLDGKISLTKSQVDAKVEELIVAFYVLEQKYVAVVY